MPGLVRPRDIIAKLGQLDEKQLCEMYARLLPRAMETNPLKEWRMTMNPTKSDLAEVLQVLPPSDMEQLEDIYFA